MGRIMLPISLASLVGVIGLQAIFHVLQRWIPTSFILWVLFSAGTGLNHVINSLFVKKDLLFGKFNRLNDKVFFQFFERFALAYPDTFQAIPPICHLLIINKLHRFHRQNNLCLLS
ncbi:MAG: hypothetical protein Q7R50_00335 [Dehalococcoidales bacterium]|nr:hypothetical protein [Dehalococcoidales bacterium]